MRQATGIGKRSRAYTHVLKGPSRAGASSSQPTGLGLGFKYKYNKANVELNCEPIQLWARNYSISQVANELVGATGQHRSRGHAGVKHVSQDTSTAFPRCRICTKNRTSSSLATSLGGRWPFLPQKAPACKKQNTTEPHENS